MPTVAMSAKTVLIIDDSTMFRKLVSVTIKQFGIFDNTLFAKDGSEGLEMAAHNPVNLVICDINMPVMNGLDFLKNFRQNEYFKLIPVIMITTEGRDEDKNQAFSLGANSFLNKPFNPDDLKSEILRLLPPQ